MYFAYKLNKQGDNIQSCRTSSEQLEPDVKQQTGSKLGKGYVKAVYCHPAYLTYMQSTSWEMLGCMKHKLKSRLPGSLNSFCAETQRTWASVSPDTRWVITIKRPWVRVPAWAAEFHNRSAYGTNSREDVPGLGTVPRGREGTAHLPSALDWREEVSRERWSGHRSHTRVRVWLTFDIPELWSLLHPFRDLLSQLKMGQNSMAAYLKLTTHKV